MFLRQFHYVVALEHESHFGRAAKRCNVSQPTLSSGIKQLEVELGIPIIMRHQKFQGFTAEGARVVEWSKRLLADRAAMVEELAIMRDSIHGHLRIGAMPMSSPLLPVISSLFIERHPKVQLDIQFVGYDEMTLGLKNFELDVGITYLDDQHPLLDYETLPLYQKRLSLLLPDNDWLAGKKTATWEDAAKLPLCLLSPNMHERKIMDDAFDQVGGRPRPILESNSILQLAFHVMSGNIATVVPQHFSRTNNVFQGTRELVLKKPVVSQQIGLVYAKGTPIQPMARAIVNLLEEEDSIRLLKETFSTNASQ